MKTFATTTFAVALLGMAACKGGSGDNAKLIPKAATVLVGVDLAALQGTQSWKDNKEKALADGKEMIEAMDACKLGLDKWKSVTIGMDPADAEEKMAVVVKADGIGVKANLECAHDKIKEKSGDEEPWKVEDDGKVLKMDDGKVAYVIDDNTIVLAGKAWADDVKKLVGGEGESAFDGLKDVLALTDTSKHVWGAGILPDEAKGMAKMAGDIGEPQNVAGWLDFGGGVELFLAVGFKDGDEATKAKETAEKQWEGVKAIMAGQFGVPQDVVDSVKFDTKDKATTVTAKASADDLKAIEGKLKEQFGM